jgi:hypothetical protein
MVRERGDAPVDPDAYAAAARPLWQSPPVLLLRRTARGVGRSRVTGGRRARQAESVRPVS